MSDFPEAIAGDSAYGVISTASEACPVSDAMLSTGQTFGNVSAWPLANYAIFAPFILRRATSIYNFAWINGQPVSGNVDFGIYDAEHSRLVSIGSTAQVGGGVDNVQAVAITPLNLSPGLYYMAMAMDNATGLIYSSGLYAGAAQSAGLAGQTAAFPLPATATFAFPSRDYVPLISCGVIDTVL